MHAVAVRVTIGGDEQEGLTFLREQVVPRVSGAPGFVTGHWVRLEGDKGTSLVVFESEEQARSAAEAFQPPPNVTLDSVEVGEVVANA